MDHDLRQKDMLREDFSFYTLENGYLILDTAWTVIAFATVLSLHLWC